MIIDIENENMNQTDTVKIGLGERFKSAREAMSLTIKEAAAHLNLSINIIDIIEREQFEEGPPATFMRGYVRSYARFLNIPDHELGQTLHKLSTTIPLKGQPLPILRTRSFESTDRYLHWITYLIIITLIIMVGLWWHSHQRYVITDVPTKNLSAPILPESHNKPNSTPAVTQESTYNSDVINQKQNSTTTSDPTTSQFSNPANTTNLINNTNPVTHSNSTANANTNSNSVPNANSAANANTNSNSVPNANSEGNPDSATIANTTTNIHSNPASQPNSTTNTNSTGNASNAALPPASPNPVANPSANISPPPQVDTPPILTATSETLELNPTTVSETPPPVNKPAHKHKHNSRQATLPGMPGVSMALPEPN